MRGRAGRRSPAPRRTRRPRRCPGRPAASAASSAPGSISPARAVLTSSASGFISARWRAVTIPRVSGESFRCRLTTSRARAERLEIGLGLVPVGRVRARATPRVPRRARCIPSARPYAGDERADRAVADDPERPAVQLAPDRRLPGARRAARRRPRRGSGSTRGSARASAPPGRTATPTRCRRRSRAACTPRVDVGHPASRLADQPQVRGAAPAAVRRSAFARGSARAPPRRRSAPPAPRGRRGAPSGRRRRAAETARSSRAARPPAGSPPSRRHASARRIGRAAAGGRNARIPHGCYDPA